jgi:hypothetical protein
LLGAVVEFIAEVVLGGFYETIRPKPGPGMCARCRKRPAVVTVPGGGAQLVCERCAHVVARNHRAGALFFAGIALLMGVMGLLLGLEGLRHGEPTSIPSVLVFVLAGVVLPAGASLAIWAATWSHERTVPPKTGSGPSKRLPNGLKQTKPARR